MAQGRTEKEFSKFMAERKIEIEAFLSEFEAIATKMDVRAIASGRGSMKLLYEHLLQQIDIYGDMDELNLSEPQIAKYRRQASDLLAKHPKLLEGLSRLCVEIYKTHADDCFEANNESQTDTFKSQSNLVWMATSNFHNYTDSGVEFCLALSRIGFLFTDYVKPLLTKWFDGHKTKRVCQKLVDSALGFTYNMFYKNNSTIYDRLSHLQVVEPVMPYLRSPHLDTRVSALCLIAFALDESKSQLYESSADVMQFLVTGLQKSVDSDNRRYRGYHVVELSACVNRLALNEVNKKLLVDLELLPVLHNMCTRGTEDEVAAALEILLALSFKVDNRMQIQKQFFGVLQKLFSSSETISSGSSLWRKCISLQGLDLNLGGQISVSCPSISTEEHHTSSAGPHVMISYHQEQKPLVMRLKDALVQNGITVWIDYEHMHEGSTMGVMTQAVEDSYAFLMCMSRTYKDSNNCRLEAEYAYKTQRRVVPLLLEPKYRPNGWLGLMLGIALCHDFTGKHPFDRQLDDLLAVLCKARPDEVEVPIAVTRASLTGRAPGALDPNFTSWEFVLDNKGKKLKIGEGGFGQVYQAITDKYQTVAVKIVKLMNATEVMLERAIEQEKAGIEILKEIRHQNIVLFLKSERKTGGRFCIFTELISGYSLSDIMNRQQMSFDEAAVKNFSSQICSALNFLHCGQRRPILHRDIKCSNIMLTHEGVIKLIDFGLAKEIFTTIGRYSTNVACGTWHFMAPELFNPEEKAQYTPKSDVWAFGCTVFEMLEMKPPNSKLSMMQIPMALLKTDMPQLKSGVSDSLRGFYSRCVARKLSERADTTELLQHEFLVR